MGDTEKDPGKFRELRGNDRDILSEMTEVVTRQRVMDSGLDEAWAQIHRLNEQLRVCIESVRP